MPDIDVNIRTRADTSGAEKEKAALAGVREEAEKANTAARGGGPQAAELEKSEAAASGLSTAIGAGFIAGYALQGVIENVARSLDEARITAEQESVEFQKHVDHWRELASSAQTFTDLQKLQVSIAETINGLYEKSRQIQSEGTKGLFQNAIDSAKLYGNSLGKLIGVQTDFKTSTDEEQQALYDQAEAAAAAGRTMELLAKRNIDFIESLKSFASTYQLEELKAKLEKVKDEQAGLNTETTKGRQHAKEYQIQIEALSSAITKLEKEEAKAKETSSRLEQEIARIDFSQLSAPEQLTSLQSDLEKVRSKLHEIGVEAGSPRQALAAVRGEYDEHAVAVRELALQWTKLTAEIKKTSDTQTKAADEAAKAHAKEQAAIEAEITKLQEKATTLRNTVLTVGDPKKREEAIKDLEKINSELETLYKKQGEAPKSGTGLEKWLLDIIADARTTAVELGNAQRALAKLYQEQGKPQPSSAPFGGNPNDYIQTPNGPIYVAPDNGPFASPPPSLFPDSFQDTFRTPQDGGGSGGAPAAIKASAAPIPPAIDAVKDAATTGFGDIHTALTPLPDAIKTAAQSIPGKLTEVQAATTTGFDGIGTGFEQMSQAVAQSYNALNRRIDDANRQIDRLWQAG